MGNEIINGSLFDFSLPGLWLFTGVRICAFNLISGVRVRSRVGGPICFNCGSRAFVFAYSIRSRRARAFAGQRTDLFPLFAVLSQVRLIAGDRVLRFADTGLTNSSSCVVIRCMVYMGFGFLRANLILFAI